MKKIFLSIVSLFILHLSGGAQSYLAKWNSTTSAMEIKQVDLVTNAVTDICVSTKIHGEYDIDKIYFNKENNQIVALYNYEDLWKYDLTTNTEQIVDLGSIRFSFFVVDQNKAFLMYYTTAANYYIQQIDLATNVITNIGGTTAIESRYHITEVNLDAARNQLVALYESKMKLWKYNLTTKTDNVILIGGVTGINYSDILITPEDSYVTSLQSKPSRIQVRKINLGSGELTNVFTSAKVTGSYDLKDLFIYQDRNQIVSLYKDTCLWKLNLNTNTEEFGLLNGIKYTYLTVYNKPKASASVTLSDLTAVYNGSEHKVTATTTPPGLAVNITYNGSATVPKNAGTYSVVASINDPDYIGKSTGSLFISKAQATIVLSDLSAVYDGFPKQATVTTTPANLSCEVLYDGSFSKPSNIGEYEVSATIGDINYEGSSTGILTISASTPTSVTNAQWTNVQLFPNPTKDILYIYSVPDVTTISISSVSGVTQLKKENCSQDEQFDISHLSKGIYVVTIEALSGKSSYQLVVNE